MENFNEFAAAYSREFLKELTREPTQFEKLMRDKYGIARPMAPEEDADDE